MKNNLKLQIALTSILNLWYGAFCWNYLGLRGILIGSIFLTSAIILSYLHNNTKIKT